MKIGANGQPEDLLQDDVKQTESTENEASASNPEKGKGSFRDRIENFWYFHKWETIIGAVIAFGIIISVFQLIGSADPDAYIMYVGKGTLYVKDKDIMADIAEEYMNDYNDDGEKSLGLLEITVGIPTGTDPAFTAYQTNSDAVKRFNTEVAVGESVIYIVEESFYAVIRDMDVVEKLSTVVDPEFLPNNRYDEYGVRVSSLDFFKQDGFASVPDDLILCIRRSPDKDDITYGRSTSYWNSNKKLFNAMFSYKAEDTEPDDDESSDTSEAPRVFDTKKFDAAIMYVGYETVYETTGKTLSASAQSYLTDANGSGLKTIGLDYRIIERPASAETAFSAPVNALDAAYFNEQIQYGNDAVFIIERSFYESIKSSDILVPYSELLNEAEAADAASVGGDGIGVPADGLQFFSAAKGFDSLGDDLVVCIRRPEKLTQAEYDCSVSLFKGILTYKAVS